MTPTRDVNKLRKNLEKFDMRVGIALVAILAAFSVQTANAAHEPPKIPNRIIDFESDVPGQAPAHDPAITYLGFATLAPQISVLAGGPTGNYLNLAPPIGSSFPQVSANPQFYQASIIPPRDSLVVPSIVGFDFRLNSDGYLFPERESPIFFEGGEWHHFDWNDFYGKDFGGFAAFQYISSVDIDNIELRFSNSFVPEPSTWALMVLGVGAIGTTLRRQRRRHGPAARVIAA